MKFSVRLLLRLLVIEYLLDPRYHDSNLMFIHFDNFTNSDAYIQLSGDL